MNCLFHEYEVVDDGGDLHVDKVKIKIPDSVKEVAYRLLDTCLGAHEPGETLCDRAFLLHTCWKQADPVVRPHENSVQHRSVQLTSLFSFQHYFLP